jgi:hypothetical protein
MEKKDFDLVNKTQRKKENEQGFVIQTDKKK